MKNKKMKKSNEKMDFKTLWLFEWMRFNFLQATLSYPSPPPPPTPFPPNGEELTSRFEHRTIRIQYLDH